MYLPGIWHRWALQRHVREGLLGQDVPPAGVGVVVHEPGQAVAVELIELVGGEDVLPQDRLRAHDGAHEHRRAHGLGPGQEGGGRPEAVGVHAQARVAEAGEPVGGGLEVLDLPGEGDDVVVRAAQAGEVELQGGEALAAVMLGQAVESPGHAVAVGEEAVGQEDRRLAARGDGGAAGHALLQGLDVEGRGALGQHERSGQSDAPGCIYADLGHGPNLGQAPGRDRGVGGGVVPIALPA